MFTLVLCCCRIPVLQTVWIFSPQYPMYNVLAASCLSIKIVAALSESLLSFCLLMGALAITSLPSYHFLLIKHFHWICKFSGEKLSVQEIMQNWSETWKVFFSSCQHAVKFYWVCIFEIIQLAKSEKGHECFAVRGGPSLYEGTRMLIMGVLGKASSNEVWKTPLQTCLLLETHGFGTCLYSIGNPVPEHNLCGWLTLDMPPGSSRSPSAALA